MASRPFRGGQDVTNYGTVSGDDSMVFDQGNGGENLSRIIGDSVMAIKQNTQNLKGFERQVGTSSDSNDLRERIQSLIKSTLHKVSTSKQQLSDLMQMAGSSIDKGQKLSANSMQQKLTSAIKDFENVFQRVLNKLELHREPPRKASGGYLDSGELEIKGENAQLMRSEQQQSLIVSTDRAYLEERADRLSSLEENIVTLHTIMGEIGQMVVVQGEQIDTIEANVENASENIVVGTKELEHTVTLKRCSRKLICIISTVVGVIVVTLLIVIIIVIAVANKK